jgi:hypothetical protein
VTDAALKAAVRPLLDCVTVDEAVYGQHGDLRAAVIEGVLPNFTAHWRSAGNFEGRIRHDYQLSTNVLATLPVPSLRSS